MTEPTFNGGNTLPRDITRYEPTTHFWQRLKYRTQPSPSKAIARSTIERGDILNTHRADRVIFELALPAHTWRVLVAVNEAAFENPDDHHYLLTIYAKGVHDGEHGEVFDEVES